MKLSPVYEPSQFEEQTYRIWEQSNAFVPKNRGNKDSYSIVVPPPNANGNLHIGHALTFALQDIVIRYQRMLGKATLFLPGADHAGFETQVVYEKELAKAGKSRLGLSREDLYQQIWDFVAKNKENYEGQLRRLGASVDWNHFTFTLDDKIIDRANKTFKKMWDDGLIYRGERLVNFCTFHGTAFADIEVEYKDIAGHLWEITYPLTDGSGEITIATTRPETMLGDTAVAVNPKDKKLSKLLGKTVKLPLTQREIPIIADEMVDITFGTGAVKITPAHDQNDFDAGERHDLPRITVIGHDGLMTHEAGEAYRGLTVDQARKLIIKNLKKSGYLNKTIPYNHNVGHCYKCGTIIQPLLREQWFVNMKPLAKKAIDILKDGQISFYPEQKLEQLITYLEGLRDWNISRQIAWGIPIPAFQNLDDPEDWKFNTQTEKEFIEINGQTYRRDPDVFDTWFSSSQWPFATLDYPDGEAYKQFYPLSLMETGVDILAPWVSRMIMLGLYITGEVPFWGVYFHGLVLDEYGAKMSKSKGNVVNPMDMVEKFGSDALRMGIITGQSAGNNQPFGEPKIVGARNFCNKLWNIARYIEIKVGKGSGVPPSPTTAADHWVLKILQFSSKNIGLLLDEYRFSEAYDTVYHTVWDEIADWYIEASKHGTGDGMLEFVLETILKLAHPFAPFITETIWQTLAWKPDTLLITEKWPTLPTYNKTEASRFEEIKEVVTEVRQLTKNLKLSRPTLIYNNSQLLAKNAHLITKLSNIGGTEQGNETTGIRLISADARLLADKKCIQAYRQELVDKIIQITKNIANLEQRLANKTYVSQAPAHIVQQTRDNLAEAVAEYSLLQAEQKRFN